MDLFELTKEGAIKLCEEIADEKLRANRCNMLANSKTNFPFLNLWMAFYAHLGRIHDMVKRIAEDKEVRKPELVKPLEEYWKHRHIILHGPKIPLKFINSVLGAPEFGEGTRRWNDKMCWEELGSTDFRQISQSVSSILRELEPILERFFAQVRKLLPACCDWKIVNWDDVLSRQVFDEENGRLYVSASALQISPPPSGMASGIQNINKEPPQ